MSTLPSAREPGSGFARDLREHLASQGGRTSQVPDVEEVRRGFDLVTLDDLRTRLGLSQETMEQLLGSSIRTLQRRRKGESRLTPVESDRLWRILHVMDRALRAFEGDEASARAWLVAPKALLSGESPLERLDTEPGLRQVEDMLTVIDETSAA